MKKQIYLITFAIIIILLLSSFILAANAMCVAKIGNVQLICNTIQGCNYDITNGIKNITVKYASNVTNASQATVQLYLCKKSATISTCINGSSDRISVIANGKASNYKAEFCSGSNPCFSLTTKLTSGEYKLMTLIDPKTTSNLNGANLIDIWNVSIMPTLKITNFACGTGIGVTGQEITCTYKIVDASTGLPPSGTPSTEVEVLYDDSPLELTSNVVGSFSFISTGVGAVKATIIASLSNPLPYINAESSTSVTINPPTMNQKLIIDGVDSKTAIPIKASATPRKLVLKVDKSGNSIDISTIQATIQLPAGCPSSSGCSIDFTNINGEWTSYYKFDLPSQVYTLDAQVTFTDSVNNPVLDINYPISTQADSAIITPKDYTTYIIIGIILLIIIIGTVIFVVLYKGKGVKRK